MRRNFQRGARKAFRGAGWLLLLAVLAGCAASGVGNQVDSPPVDELNPRDGQVCPRRLPHSAGDQHGFGPTEPAAGSPALAPAESAWVCRYDPVEAGPGADGSGTTYRWERADRARRFPASGLAEIDGYLADLAPADSQRFCTADLGPRWMLVHLYKGDLTGVVIDDFGCHEVRLTDEPFSTPPGQASEPGTVPGVLQAPEGFLEHVKAMAGELA